MNALVSVVVPVYKIEDYLKKCIDGLIEQTYTNIEIILVDDGSPDNCGKICDDYALKDKRIRAIHQQNRGPVNARKVGGEIATGDFLMYVDGDDFLDECYIEDMMQYARDDIDIIWDLVFKKNFSGDEILSGYKKYSKNELVSNDVQHFLLEHVKGGHGFQNEISFVLWAKIFRRSFIQEIQVSVCDDISYEDDFACLIRCVQKTSNIKFVIVGGYSYVQRSNSLSREIDSIGKKNNIMLEDTLAYFKQCRIADKRIIDLIKTQYIISQIQHGGIELFQSERYDFLFPFPKIKKTSKCIVYGIGKFGVSVLTYMKKSNEYVLVGCMDSRNLGRLYEGVPVLSFSSLRNIDYDYIMVGAVKQEFIDEIISALSTHGIQKEKIACVDYAIMPLAVDF